MIETAGLSFFWAAGFGSGVVSFFPPSLLSVGEKKI
jgi:hypothetical protein